MSMRSERFDGIRNYEAASMGRLAQGWHTAAGDADAVIGKESRLLRARARDAVRNNPHAAKAVTGHADHFYGPGIVPRAVVKGDRYEKVINDTFDAWSKVAFAGGLSYHAGCHVATRTMIQDGEVFIRRRWRRTSDGLPVPMQLQLLESEFCDWGKHNLSPTDNPVVSGIEFDKIGNRRGYWMFPQNPESSRAATALAVVSSFIAAADIAHLYESQSPQSRGVPWLAPVLTELKDLRDYEISENIRKKVESCVVGLIIPGEDHDPNTSLGLQEKPAAVTDTKGHPFERMEPGMFGILNGGKDIRFNTPAISAGIESYIRTRQRSIAAGARMPYEILTGDLSNANFATGKLSLLNYYQFVKTGQKHFLIPLMCQRIWDWFIEALRIVGKIPDTLAVGVEWHLPEVESVTRLDDARADLMEMRMGKRSPQDVISRTGRNPDTVLAEIDAFFGKVDETESAIVLDSDPRKVTLNGQLQLKPEAKEADDAGEA